MVEPSPEIVKVLTAACRINSKITLAEFVGNSNAFINAEPDVITFNSNFLLLSKIVNIPFLPVGPNVILTESSISFIACKFSSKLSSRENFFHKFVLIINKFL